jgi:predicted site-specific integrase-resolvase
VKKGKGMNDELNGWGEVAGFLRVSVVTAWRYERDGGMPIVRLFNGQIRASKTEIKAWIVETDRAIRELKEGERT